MIGDERDFRASDGAAAELVVDHVRGRIERAELRPGDRLPPERELAQRIGVSRPSVRAVLSKASNPPGLAKMNAACDPTPGWTACVGVGLGFG